MGRVGAYRPFVLGHEDIKEMAGIYVATKEIERVSHQLGEEAEVFYKKETALSLSGKIIPINPVPKMYICIDGTGIPVVTAETVNRKGTGEDCHAKTREDEAVFLPRVPLIQKAIRSEMKPLPVM